MWNIVTHPAKNGLLRIRFNVSNLQSLLHYSHLDQTLPYLFRTHLALDIFGLMTNIFPNQDNPPISRAETMLLYHASVWKRGRRVKHSDYSYMLSRINRIYLQILDDSPQIHANTSCVFQHHAIDYSVIFNAWYSNPPDYSAQYLNGIIQVIHYLLQPQYRTRNAFSVPIKFMIKIIADQVLVHYDPALAAHVRRATSRHTTVRLNRMSHAHWKP
eukprot:58544_1